MNQETSKQTAADISTRLSYERTDAAMTRTRMALDRTLMAWIRTSLSMISFGFTILKFFEFLSESQGPLGHFHGQRARHLGLVGLGLGSIEWHRLDHRQRRNVARYCNRVYRHPAGAARFLVI